MRRGLEDVFDVSGVVVTADRVVRVIGRFPQHDTSEASITGEAIDDLLRLRWSQVVRRINRSSLGGWQTNVHGNIGVQ